MKMKFSQLNKKTQEEMCMNPQIVFMTQNPDDETYEQEVEAQDRFLKLSENVKDKLSSYQTAEKIQRIGKHYKLELLQVASVARLIRSYYFGDIKESMFPEILMKETGIDQKSASEISRYVIERIIKTDINKKESDIRILKLSLVQAMERYPKVQDQIISDNLIKISGKEDMVKGSVRNWIKDYYAVVGAGNHDVMKRSSYVYHSQNAKSISATEKQKLGFIIKSLDENDPLTIDSEKEEIVFNVSANVNKNKPPVNTPIRNNPVVAPQATQDKKEDIYENKKKEIVFGDKKEDHISQENNPAVTGSSNLGGQAAPKTSQLGGQAKINHVQGNRFNLKSDHFEDTKEVKPEKTSEMFGKKYREDSLDSSGVASDENIKFSAPQQLPVEKEKGEEARKKGFLRRIRSVD